MFTERYVVDFLVYFWLIFFFKVWKILKGAKSIEKCCYKHGKKSSIQYYLQKDKKDLYLELIDSFKKVPRNYEHVVCREK